MNKTHQNSVAVTRSQKYVREIIPNIRGVIEPRSQLLCAPKNPRTSFCAPLWKNPFRAQWATPNPRPWGEERKRRRRKKGPGRIESLVRNFLAFFGFCFILFNLFLVSKIKPSSLDDGKAIPHKEKRTPRAFNFEVDIDFHDKSAPRVLKSTTSSTSTTSTTLSSETSSKESEPESEEKKAEVIPGNPLLAQLQKKEGVVQTAQLIDRVRYLIAENPDESIPKRYADNTTVPDLEFMITPEVDCVRKDLVIFVKSRVESSGLREIIRNTWAHTHAIEKWSIATIFLVGKSDSKYLNKNLQNEGRDKQDLLVGDYLDAYQNLTSKSISGLQWFANECTDSRNYLSVDDDVFPDLPLILGFLNKAENSQVELACLYNYVQHARVTRKGKWQTSWESYGKEFYPVYCEGACFSMPRWAAVKLFKNAQVTYRDAPVDDAYLTGVLREKAGLIPKQVQNKRMCKHLVNDDEIIQKLRAEWAQHQP